MGLYAPCFVAGVICYLLLKTRRPLPFWLFPLTLAALMLAYMVGYARFGMQAGLGMLVTLSLAFAIPRFAPLRAPWLRTSSHTIAKYSYGIYLFHSPCLWHRLQQAPLPAAARLRVRVHRPHHDGGRDRLSHDRGADDRGRQEGRADPGLNPVRPSLGAPYRRGFNGLCDRREAWAPVSLHRAIPHC